MVGTVQDTQQRLNAPGHNDGDGHGLPAHGRRGPRLTAGSGETGRVIRLIRQAIGWSQQDLANRSDYSQATISRLERGMSRAARDTDILADVAEALGAPPAALGVVGQSDELPLLDDAAPPARPAGL
jgi:DNA-binding XRE family transcriptional regulator